MSNWIIPCNVSLYDPIGAFAELGQVDWRQSTKVKEGDEVFIYCSRPYQKVMFRTKVMKANISVEDVDCSDLRFNRKSNTAIGDNPRFGYMRLKLINCRDSENLSLKELCKLGINKAPQGPMKISDEQYEYFCSVFDTQ